MPIQGDTVYKTQQQVVEEVLAAWLVRIPDINVSPDTIVRIWTEVFANSVEGVYLGLQLLHDDMFVQTMSALALARAGDEYGRGRKAGVLATGSVRLAGAAGEYVAAGSQIGAPRPALNDTLVFETTDDATIPSPGSPDAPTVVDAAVGGNLTGTIEWAITFTTAEGETEVGVASDALVLAASRASLTAISLGGFGTLTRKVYRRKNGGDWQYVDEIADNTTDVYTDNVADVSLGGAPPAESTAERVTVTAAAIETGIDYNVGIGAISTLVNVNADVTSVTNTAAFTGGTDDESTEAFRQALLKWVQAPQSGSPDDLIAWATSIEGVDFASVYKNVDLAGDPALGSVVVRIAGPDGAVPDGDTVTAVQDYLDSRDLANITILVGTFTPLTVAVEVTVTLAGGYALADVEGSVIQAAVDYVNSVPVGGTVYVAGVYHAIFTLTGIETLVVVTPATDTVAAVDEKPVLTALGVTVSET